MEKILIDGQCDPRFERVRDVFIENFSSRGEVGAAFALTLDGRSVIDLWGGYTDEARTRPWRGDTIVTVYSTTKGLTAMCAHRLVDQGKLDLNAPVAKYWPEFAQAGKEKMPVHFLLSHRAGLAAVRKPLKPDDIFNWQTMTSALAAETPWWEPGTRHGYHAFTYGWLVGEVVRRVSGKSLGTYFRDEIAKPFGIDCHIGLAAEHDARVAEMIPSTPRPGDPDPLAEMLKDPESLTAKVIMNPPNMLLRETANSRAYRAAEIPAANAHTTARALARVYGALSRGGQTDGIRLLTPESIVRCYTEQASGPDAVMLLPTRIGLGFMLSQPGASLGPNPHAFGHPGAGGSLGFADPDAGIGFGYTMNQMQPGLLVDARAAALIDAIYASL